MRQTAFAHVLYHSVSSKAFSLKTNCVLASLSYPPLSPRLFKVVCMRPVVVADGSKTHKRK